MRPNLFEFATSELSQDAFISWLLSWADPENKRMDLMLNECGQALIHEFLAKHGKHLELIKSVRVQKQHKHIDVLCVVNNDYYIIIEDKTTTSQQSGQLARYVDVLKKEGVANDKIIPIYFKIYDQSNYKEIENDRYRVFQRQDVLKIMGQFHGRTNNTVFCDYYERLQHIEDDVKKYADLSINDEWSDGAWTGLFMALKKELNDGECEWENVPNPSGGFMGFWWHFKPVPDSDVRLYVLLKCKLKYANLCINIKVPDKTKQAELREMWHNRIMQQNQSIPVDCQLNLKKPKRFGKGKNMTVAELDGDYRQFNEQGKLDIQATSIFLHKAEVILDEAAKAG